MAVGPLRTAIRAEARAADRASGRLVDLLPYLVLGLGFGAVLVKSQVVSWFRIQEMFRFDSFYMYGVLLSAAAVARVSLVLIRRTTACAMTGEPIGLAPKTMGSGIRYGAGGMLFGIGWSLTGACPGPLVALTFSGATVYVVALASALAGAWAYGWARPHLPQQAD